MGLDPLALDDGFRVPFDPKPPQAFEDVGGVFGFAALFVGVLDAQQEFATEMPGEKPVEDRGPRGTDGRVPVGLGARRTRTAAPVPVTGVDLKVETGLTGFEPATSAVTGRCSNRLNYSPLSALRALSVWDFKAPAVSRRRPQKYPLSPCPPSTHSPLNRANLANWHGLSNKKARHWRA